ncbi:phosphotransferase [Lederbergia sp. NSJ-179]|uniref:phosphotransferase n=1 Tax=Lederbergia sp. NSJ-179 TaxID=2931402 RepID=UPI001FCFC77A|nr:phosphotransferase [Lederbergia sp. NSJ-179]MCJ7843123.1 phosphotransferase [Lederbergia sp. NSJ-179]
MENLCSEQVMLHDLLKTCHRQFGFHVVETHPIKRGWLNLKWKVTTDTGVFLIKQYNKERYKLYNHEELVRAFHQQMRLYNSGVPCPMLLSYEEEFLFHSDNGELFIVMEYCNGDTVPPGQVNARQMFHLGQLTGYTHQVLNDGTLGKRNRPEFVPPSREERILHWKSVWNQAHHPNLPPILETQIRMTELVNLDEFNAIETGWAHRDLWVDNVLFRGSHVSAILDLDRLKFDYPQLDVARAVISGALANGELDVSLASAFIEGYGEYHSVEKGFLTNALKLLWYMESPWWITAKMDKHTGPPKRFAEEMIWLANNYGKLELLLKNI